MVSLRHNFTCCTYKTYSISKNLWTNCCFSLVLNQKSEHHFLQELSVSSVGCFGWWCRSRVLIPRSFLCLFPLFICYLLLFPTCRRTHLAELLVRSLICGQISLCVYVHTYIIIIVICLFVCLFVYPPRQSLGKSQTRNRFYPGKTMRWDLLEKAFKEILYYVFRAITVGCLDQKCQSRFIFFSTGHNRCVRQEIVTQCFVSTELGLWPLHQWALCGGPGGNGQQGKTG